MWCVGVLIVSLSAIYPTLYFFSGCNCVVSVAVLLPVCRFLINLKSKI